MHMQTLNHYNIDNEQCGFYFVSLSVYNFSSTKDEIHRMILMQVNPSGIILF